MAASETPGLSQENWDTHSIIGWERPVGGKALSDGLMDFRAQQPGSVHFTSHRRRSERHSFLAAI